MYISSDEPFAPALYAVVGATGDSIRSYFANTSSYAREISVRTCNAFL